MFDVEKYEKIKTLYKLMLTTDILIIFSAFGFVYVWFEASYLIMIYIICLVSGICVKYWIKNKIKELK